MVGHGLMIRAIVENEHANLNFHTGPVLPIEYDEMTHEFPGDGLGTDDLADYNKNEVNDYLDE